MSQSWQVAVPLAMLPGQLDGAWQAVCLAAGRFCGVLHGRAVNRLAVVPVRAATQKGSCAQMCSFGSLGSRPGPKLSGGWGNLGVGWSKTRTSSLLKGLQLPQSLPSRLPSQELSQASPASRVMCWYGFWSSPACCLPRVGSGGGQAEVVSRRFLQCTMIPTI